MTWFFKFKPVGWAFASVFMYMKTYLFKSIAAHIKNSLILSIHGVLIFGLIASGCGSKKSSKSPLSSNLRRDLNEQKEKELKERCSKPEFANEEQCIKLNTAIGGDCRLYSDQEVAAIADKDAITKQQIATLKMCDAIGVQIAADGAIQNPASEISVNVGAIMDKSASVVSKENVNVQLADKKIRKTERYTQIFKREKVQVISPYIDKINELANKSEEKPEETKDEKKEEKPAAAAPAAKPHYVLDLAFQLAMPKDKVDLNSITIRFGQSPEPVLNVADSLRKNENKFVLNVQESSTEGQQLILRVVEPSLFKMLPYEVTIQFLVAGGEVVDAPAEEPAAEAPAADAQTGRTAAAGTTDDSARSPVADASAAGRQAPAQTGQGGSTGGDPEEGSEVRTRTTN